ncbi:MAG: NAD(P)-dependent alcohol dehydrogenase [Acidimicrobiales bacterium]
MSAPTSNLTSVPRPTTMRAIVRDRYGVAGDVLRLEEIARPVAGDDQVLLRVHAAGVGRDVWHTTTGRPLAIRLAGYGVRVPKVRTPGSDVAGTVVAVGKDVTTAAVGDEVFGVGIGSFAEYAVASASKIAPKPANLTFEQAAATPITALTALQSLRDRGEVRSGQHVLVIGASGGVGSFAAQIAKAFGAEVTGVCSTAKVEMVRALGVDHVIDYQVDHFADGGRRYDVIIDVGGNSRLSDLRRALTAHGTLVIAGGETEGLLLGGAGRQVRAVTMSPFLGQRLRTVLCSHNREDLVTLTELIEAGSVTPAIGSTYPLSDAATALQHVADGRARGKVVIRVADGG